MATPAPTIFKFKGQISAFEGPDQRGQFLVKVSGITQVYMDGFNQEVRAEIRIGAPRTVLGALSLGDQYEFSLEKK